MMGPADYKKVDYVIDHHCQLDDSAQLTRVFGGHWACTVIVAVVPSCTG
jgi:hypothetical protein